MSRNLLKASLLIGAALMSSALLAQAQQPMNAAAQGGQPGADLPLDAQEGRTVATKLADELVADFVYPEQAKAYAAMLRKNAAAGRYDHGTRQQLADMLTNDMQAVHKDGHLHIELAEPDDGGKPGAQAGKPMSGRPPLIQSARTIAPGIGYIRFTAFLSTDEEVAAVRKWLGENRDAKVLIFDLRNHHGGRLGEQDAIFASVFDKRTPLVKMAVAKSLFEERGSPFHSSASLRFEPEGSKMVATHYAIPGEASPLRKAKIFLLVSNKTASAGEHFSLAMKSTGRGTLIGEPTAGANHFGGPEPLNEHFAVWMPVGRTYDIKSGKDWEGTGVAPDIAVDPSQALIVALEKAGLPHDEALRLNSEEVPAEPVHADKLRAR